MNVGMASTAVWRTDVRPDMAQQGKDETEATTAPSFREADTDETPNERRGKNEQ